jgi:hypothetical protein
VQVASRFGRLELRRQVFAPVAEQPHCMPGNAVLPAHHGMIITRGLQELACLWPQDLPFAPVARLMGWQAQTEAVLSDTSIRTLVRAHGQIIRQAEQKEVRALLEHPDLTTLQPQLVPATQPRRRAGWPPELSAAVDQALQDGLADPPAGVSRADWERVLHARRQEAALPLETLRQLGPQVQPEQTLVNTDEVLTRALGTRRFWEIRTARVSTPAGTRYLSGTGPALLRQMLVLVLLCAVRWPAVLIVADGARWIRAWFSEVLAALPDSALILDWWHLCKRCRELASMACRGRKAKAALLRPIYRHLWQGEVAAAVALLEAYRPQAKNIERLEEWITYLRERTPYIPNYRERRRTCQYIGSGAVEKVNDLLVARRQKGQGMRWQESTSDALAALRTLMLNGGWDRYWQHHEVLPLVAT